MFDYENKIKAQGYKFIVGIDEAGRGPLAGPVVASAVVCFNEEFHSKICDSKKMTRLQREKAFGEINENAYVGIGIIDADIIDKENILNATFLAMNNAVDVLAEQLEKSFEDYEPSKDFFLLIDGNRYKSDKPYKYQTVIGGDNVVTSIAMASIIAKVTRDRIMAEYDRIYPQYGFAKHKGYPTKDHKKALTENGPCKIHRRTFRY